MEQDEPITIGVSSCLLGINVRYDGANKSSKTAIALCKQFNCIPICPEVGIGLSVPRPPIRLFSHANSTRAVLSEHPMEDVSQKLKQYAQHIAEEHPELCGYILKSGSPSCGLKDVPTFDCDENPINLSKGIFADKLREEINGLPTIDEKQLDIPEHREKFLKNVAAFHNSKVLNV